MKTPSPFWSLAAVSILAFELNPSACSFSSQRASDMGGNGGSVAGAGHTGSAGNAGLAGTSGGQGGGSGGSNLGVDAGGKITIGHTQCSDGIDNDGDGFIDYADPECVGPNDNDESSFATGIPGDNVDACKQDCFFDGNSGMGDDHCLWQLKCDPLSHEASCPYDPSYAAQHTTECSTSASQSQTCIDNCRKMVPNGCDCFGCCLIPGAPNAIRLAATCTAAKFNDPIACPPCTQVTQCMNTCDRCELCVGKTSVPADCGPTPTDSGGGTPTCSGYPSCIPGPDPGCPDGSSCVTGCCLPIVQ